MAIKLELENLRDEVAPLYFKYSSQVNPQSAFIEIDEDGTVTAGVNAEIGNGIPSRVWHKQDLRISCPSNIHGVSLIEFLEDDVGKELLTRIHSGHNVEFTGCNFEGTLTEDAENAILELGNELHEVQDIAIWSAEEWIENDSILNLWPVCTTLADAAAKASIPNDPFESIVGDMQVAIVQKAIRRQEWPSEWAKNGRWDVAKAIVERQWNERDDEDLADAFDGLFEFPLSHEILGLRVKNRSILIEPENPNHVVNSMIAWYDERHGVDLSWLPSEVKDLLAERRKNDVTPDAVAEALK